MDNDDKADELGKKFLVAAVELFHHSMPTAPVPPEQRQRFLQQLRANVPLQMTVIMWPTVRIVCRIGGEQAFGYDVEMASPIDPMKLN